MARYVFGVDLPMHISTIRAIRFTRQQRPANTRSRAFNSTTTRSKRERERERERESTLPRRALPGQCKVTRRVEVGWWLTLSGRRDADATFARWLPPNGVSSTPSTGRRLALHPVLVLSSCSCNYRRLYRPTTNGSVHLSATMHLTREPSKVPDRRARYSFENPQARTDKFLTLPLFSIRLSFVSQKKFANLVMHSEKKPTKESWTRTFKRI